MSSTIRTRQEGDGLELVDSVEGVHYELYLPSDAEPMGDPPTSTIPVPVDDVARVETTRVTIPKRVEIIVRTTEMDSVGVVDPDAPGPPPHLDCVDDPVLLEVLSVPLKLYLLVPARFNVRATDDGLAVAFPEDVAVDVAIRSFHDSAAGTVTAGPSIESEMRALSQLGSALQTTSPERSWPTLRGHPPLVNAGDAEDIPDHISRPDVDVHLTLPRDRRYLYPAVSLAYYLGASIEPSTGPPQLAAAGRVVDLADDYEDRVNRLLRRTVFLDTIARREGLYPFELARHRRALDALDDDVDWQEIYDLPLGERVATYLDDRWDVLEERDVLPTWHVTTDVSPTRGALGTLPFVARDLSLCRVAELPTAEPPTPAPNAIADFVRASRKDDEGGAEHSLASLDVARAPAPSTPEYQWIGPEPVWDATLLDQAALEQRLDHSPAEGDGYVTSITLVCNDPSMTDELVEQVYGIRDLVRYDISAHYQLSRAELEDVLQTPSDLLHYVGHVDDRGMQCSDGWLDVHSMDAVAVDAFVLNACQSYHQGKALLAAGAIAGVVTLDHIANELATRIGRQLARLLDSGLRFRSALAIIREHLPASYRYIVLGAGGYQMVESESGCPISATVERQPDRDGFELSLTYYPSDSYDVGSIGLPVLETADDHYMTIGTPGQWSVDADALRAFCEREMFPVTFEGELVWSDDLARVLSGESDEVLDDLVIEKYESLDLERSLQRSRSGVMDR